MIEIEVALNGRRRRLSVAPDARLLDVLRNDLRLTGAKEGCGKGECGACTVLVDGLAIDACLTMASQVDGADIETVEGLSTGRELDALQDAFVEHGASQCGICIPGMVMSARALLLDEPQPTRAAVREGLAGNLCRCTGYMKIFDAVQAAAGAVAARPAPAVERRQPALTLAEALRRLDADPDLRPIAGGTDLLVQAKDADEIPSPLLDLTAVPELSGILEHDGTLWIGAGTTHTELMRSALVKRYAPALPPACAVIGGPQIRNRGTLGGNLVNASPAADTVPALYVADAVVEIASVRGARTVPVDAFVVGRRRTVLEPGELVTGVRIPRPAGRGAFLRLGQREAQAISKVSVAVAWTGSPEKPDRVRVAFGAVAPTVIRAAGAERLLSARGLAALAEAAAAARDDVRPIDDLRSTADYRRAMAEVLLDRAVRAALAT